MATKGVNFVRPKNLDFRSKDHIFSFKNSSDPTLSNLEKLNNKLEMFFSMHSLLNGRVSPSWMKKWYYWANLTTYKWYARCPTGRNLISFNISCLGPAQSENPTVVKKSYFSKLLSKVESRSKWGRDEDEKVNKRLKIAWKWFSKLSKIERIIKIWLLEGWRGFQT